ncbi:MAG: zinc ribbon domain-containing protein [Thermoguttaceae bacterium]|nr:zinc ribbon domain-containing protein [Thermoguttaceae bacterium]
MPIYEYRCDDCGQVSEILVRGDETPQCESCGSTNVAKIFSTPATPTESTPGCAARDMGMCDGPPPHSGGFGCHGCCDG